MNKRYIIAGAALIGFLFIVSAIFIPQIGAGEDASRATTVSYTVQSPHKYPNNCDLWYTISEPGAAWLKLYFSAFQTEANCDYLDFYDADYNYLGSYTGGTWRRFWSPQFDTDTVHMNLWSDSSVQKWGFRITKYQYEEGTPPPPPEDTEAPVVSIDAPLNGATCEDTVTILTSVTDNVDPNPVMELSIDGGAWFTTDGSYDWDTTSFVDVNVAINARATDASSNVGTDSITVYCDNQVTPPPPEDGDTHFLGAVAGGEIDWYDIYAYAGGSAISVSVSWATGADIDCYINDVQSTTGYLARGYTTANPETCSYSPTVDGTYYIGVKMYTSSAPSTDYDCHVTWQATEPPPPPPPSGDKWAILVGISDYKAISDLNYCDEDATDWYNYLTNSVGYPDTNIRILGDGHTSNYPTHYATATEYQYKACLTWVADNADSNDVVIFATSGHGSGDGRGSSFLCAWDCNSGEAGEDGSFYDTEIDDYTHAIAIVVESVFVFVDHCYSGGLGPEISVDGNVYVATTCSDSGYGWDDGAHQNGMWTYWFLEAGLIGQFGSNPATTMGEAFDWALSVYPKSGADTPEEYNAAFGDTLVL